MFLDALSWIADALPKGDVVVEFYAKNLRGGMFSGFLTLSGFLFSMNTFIVVNMKKELYDRDTYISHIEDTREINEAVTIYGPLERLSQLMLRAVAFSLAAAVSQFTVGLFSAWPAVVICATLAGAALLYMALVLHAIRQNLTKLFQHLHKEADAKLAKRADERKASQTSGVIAPSRLSSG